MPVKIYCRLNVSRTFILSITEWLITKLCKRIRYLAKVRLYHILNCNKMGLTPSKRRISGFLTMSFWYLKDIWKFNDSIMSNSYRNKGKAHFIKANFFSWDRFLDDRNLRHKRVKSHVCRPTKTSQLSVFYIWFLQLSHLMSWLLQGTVTWKYLQEAHKTFARMMLEIIKL